MVFWLYNEPGTQDKRSNYRGQSTSIDMLIAVMIFVIILTFTISFWTRTELSVNDAHQRHRLEAEALAATDMLLKSSGTPDNWEQNISNISNTGSIGLVKAQNIIDVNKLANFTALDYSTQKEFLGASSEFYMDVKDLNGNLLYATGNTTLTGDRIITITRVALLNNQPVRLRMVSYG